MVKTKVKFPAVAPVANGPTVNDVAVCAVIGTTMVPTTDGPLAVTWVTPNRFVPVKVTVAAATPVTRSAGTVTNEVMVGVAGQTGSTGHGLKHGFAHGLKQGSKHGGGQQGLQLNDMISFSFLMTRPVN